MLLTRLLLAALSRADLPENARRPFFLYVDEFPTFATQSTLASLLSEARKYRLALTLSHQYLAQLPESLRGAIFGNVGTLLAFRVGAEDAEYLAREFAPFSVDELTNLERHHVCAKVSRDGVTSTPFAARTYSPLPVAQSSRDQIIRVSRERYARPRNVVERTIAQSLLSERRPQSLGPALRQRRGVSRGMRSGARRSSMGDSRFT